MQPLSQTGISTIALIVEHQIEILLTIISGFMFSHKNKNLYHNKTSVVSVNNRSFLKYLYFIFVPYPGISAWSKTEINKD